MNTGWRTLIIDQIDSMKLQENQIVVIKDGDSSIFPLETIRTIMVTSSYGMVSLPLLLKLAENNVQVIFCNGRKVPVCSINEINGHYEAAGRLMDQAQWSDRRKKAVWRQIVKMKIERQSDLLKQLQFDKADELSKYASQVQSDDNTNREALASKAYFQTLFGKSFIRFSDSPINSGLDYGYTILRSAFDRALALHGMNPSLGIHHCNRMNKYNLSCDLMEPFRPFVDRIVYQNADRTLDSSLKKDLIGVLYQPCMYGNKRTDVGTAIEMMVLDFWDAIMTPRRLLKEIRFV